MKRVRLWGLLLVLSFGAELFLGGLAIATEPAGPPQLMPERIALMLDRLHAPGLSAVIKSSGSCATSCGSGPESSCTKSCQGSQSRSASCSGGKAVCRCD